MLYPVKMRPAFKPYIWGGDRLKRVYGKDTPHDVTAESWELSAHPDGFSVAENGELSGLTLPEIIERWGAECIGRHDGGFPVLIKLIDAARDLSVQTHPADEYAYAKHGQPGKTELWYIMEAQPGAGIYCGFSRDTTAEEVSRRARDNTLTEILNFIPCEEGQAYLINPGTIHAIRAGIMVAEIQQNSNITYRVYDYGRRGADGQPRTLHIESALDVLNFNKAQTRPAPCRDVFVATPYFTVGRVRYCGGTALNAGAESFHALLLTKGRGKVAGVPVSAGDCVFVPAGMGEYHISGAGELLLTTL